MVVYTCLYNFKAVPENSHCVIHGFAANNDRSFRVNHIGARINFRIL